MGGGGAQRPVGRSNEPKKTGARSARARTRGQNPQVINIGRHKTSIRQFLNIRFKKQEQKHYTAVSFWLILYAFLKVQFHLIDICNERLHNETITAKKHND